MTHPSLRERGVEPGSPVADVARQLRAAGAGRVSDAFFVPVTSPADARQPRSAPLSWREQRRDVWLRAADVPFDLLTCRAADSSRDGVVFSLGPGLTAAGEFHPAVLQLQVEGLEADVEERLDRIRPVLMSVAEDLRECRSAVAGRGWARVCIVGTVPDAA
jgi:hypothetical protein